jgi:hypothetical protein
MWLIPAQSRADKPREDMTEAGNCRLQQSRGRATPGVRWRIAHQRMKTISCLMWIAITLLIAATLDRVPDPPAANPAGARLAISGPHELALAFGPPVVRLAPSQAREAGHLAISHKSEPLKSTKWIDALERGTDPSPPLVMF